MKTALCARRLGSAVADRRAYCLVELWKFSRSYRIRRYTAYIHNVSILMRRDVRSRAQIPLESIQVERNFYDSHPSRKVFLLGRPRRAGRLVRGGALIYRLYSERARPAGRLATLSNSCDPAGLKTRAIKCRAGLNDQRKGAQGRRLIHLEW